MDTVTLGGVAEQYVPSCPYIQRFVCTPLFIDDWLWCQPPLELIFIRPLVYARKQTTNV